MSEEAVTQESPAQQVTSGQSESVLGEAKKTAETKSEPQIDIDWKSEIPEEFRSAKVLNNIKGKTLQEALPVLLKNYIEAQSYIGGAVKIPKPNDPKEKWEEFYKKLGRPDEYTDYDIDTSNFPVDIVPEYFEGFLKTAHGLGLTNKQVQGLWNWYTEYVKDAYSKSVYPRDKAMEELRKEFGENFQRKMILAVRAVREFGGNEIVELLDGAGLGNHPKIIKFFADLGELLAEDGIISGEISGVIGKEEAQKKLDEIFSNLKHPYFSTENLEAHKKAVEEVNRLFKIISGE